MNRPHPAPPILLHDRWRQFLTEPSKIRDHLYLLFALAWDCEHVTEFGTRQGRSTTAFLMAQPKKLVTYDLVRFHDVDTLMNPLFRGETELVFRQEDVRQAEIEPTDLLFIDSTHTFDHVSAELSKAYAVRRWIAVHDTVACGMAGILREDPAWPGVDYHQDRPHSEAKRTLGILPAVREFLKSHPEWRIRDVIQEGTGLMVLERDPLSR